MRPPRLTVIIGLLFLMGNAAFADKVTSDFDHAVDFSKFRTFMWIQEPNPPEPFMKERIVQSINGQLQSKGLLQVTKGADLAVGAHVATAEKHTWETYYTGDGGWGWGGSGWSTTTERTYEVGTLTVDLFDTSCKRLVWQGVATDTVSYKPEKQTKHYAEWVEKMFRQFPVGFPGVTTLREVPILGFSKPILG
jgi:uncharacterized protein DUF4136